MLKLRLEPGGEFDRILEAAARSFSKVLERGVEEGVLTIASYPDLDALISSGIIYSIALSLGIRPLLRVSVKPPSRVTGPTILAGYSNLNYKASSIDGDLLAMASSQITSTPPPGSVYIEVAGSIGAMLGLITSQLGSVVVRPEHRLFSLSSSYAGRFVDKVGRFHGVDKVYVESAVKDRKLSLEGVTALKTYKPHRYGVCEGISKTVNPYYPTLTGDEEQCIRLLDSAGLRGIADSPVTRLSGDTIEKLAASVIDYVGQRIEGVDPSIYVGWMIVSESPTMTPSDPRMASDALLYASEAGRGVEPLLSSIIDKEEYTIAEGSLEHYSNILGNSIEEAKPVRLKTHSWLRVYRVDIGERDSPTLLWRALSLTRQLDQESVVAFNVEEGLAASAIQVEEALGYGAAKRLVETRVARQEGVMLWLNLETQSV